LTNLGVVATNTESELLDAAQRYLLVGRMEESRFSGPVFVSGEGSIVRDVDGREYIDFNSGQMCSALGHRNPRIVSALKQAADTMIHASSMYFNVEEVRLGEELAAILPPPLRRSIFPIPAPTRMRRRLASRSASPVATKSQART
jgi:4-aminobutyrate aminotransferase-like enzyme